MLARLSAALFGAALFAGAASAEDTTIKFKLGWTTQGSDAGFFYAKDSEWIHTTAGSCSISRQTGRTKKCPPTTRVATGVAVVLTDAASGALVWP